MASYKLAFLGVLLVTFVFPSLMMANPVCDTYDQTQFQMQVGDVKTGTTNLLANHGGIADPYKATANSYDVLGKRSTARFAVESKSSEEISIRKSDIGDSLNSIINKCCDSRACAGGFAVLASAPKVTISITPTVSGIPICYHAEVGTGHIKAIDITTLVFDMMQDGNPHTIRDPFPVGASDSEVLGTYETAKCQIHNHNDRDISARRVDIGSQLDMIEDHCPACSEGTNNCPGGQIRMADPYDVYLELSPAYW